MLNEGKQVGVIYHFTSLLSATDIIRHDHLGASGSKVGYVSFTRDKYFYKHETSDDNITSTDVRIVVDGNKISNRYKVSPYNDYSTDYIDSTDYSHTNKDLPDEERANAFNRHLDYDEKEERIQGDINDIKNYIISVDIISNEDDFGNLEKLLHWCKQYKIRVNKVDEKKINNTASFSYNPLEEEVLNEGKQVGVLYHYTSIKGILGIIKENALHASGKYTRGINGGQSYKPFISFTRDKHFHKLEHYIDGTAFRFVVDGDKLSNKYKISPYSEQSPYKRTGIEGYLRKIRRDEFEECVVAPEISNFSDYILKIELLDNNLVYEVRNAIETFCQKHGIELDVLDDEKISKRGMKDMSYLEEEEVLNEGKQVGILYHYTSFGAAASIAETNTLECSYSYNLRRNGAKNLIYYISFTRDKNFHLLNHFIGGTAVRFMVDGDKLSHNYQVTPYSDNQATPRDRMGYNRKLRRDEFEEAVLSEEIKNFSKYIVKVQIIEDNIQSHQMEIISTFCEQHNIPLETIEGEKYNKRMLQTPELVEEENIDYDSLKLQDTLNQKVWDGKGILKTEVRKAIMAVAEDFYKTLKVDINIDDIIFTGSLANYNWSKQSDIDVHLVIDFELLFETIKDNDIFDKEEFLKEYFAEKKNSWNKKHNMKIYGHEVEVYVQDLHEKHVSTGVYSVKKGEWIQTPSHVDAKPDMEFIQRKSEMLMGMIDKIVKNQDTKEADKLKEKLKNFRQRGLDADGEMSNSNLIYKILRRGGYVDKLYELGGKVFDKEFSVKQ